MTTPAFYVESQGSNVGWAWPRKGLAAGSLGKRLLKLSRKQEEERERTEAWGVGRGQAGPPGPSLMGCGSEGKDGSPT